uniref:thioester-forming surface-anchored protein n=1 Tax=Atopobacter phocae TaxID=136492 RepID=UPI0004719EEF
MKKKFISFILSFMLIALGLLPSNVMAEGFNSSDEFNYIGYQEGGIGNIRKLAVVDKETNDNKRIVYCFNKEYHWPGGIRDINGFAYKKTTGDVVSFQNHVNEKSKYKGEKLINALKIILTQGYPNGKIIQKSLNLSDDKYREITQMAVWHFTDGQYINIGQLQSLPKDEEALALSILLTNAKSEILDNDVLDYYLKAYQDKQPTYQIPEEIEKIPENSTLDLYISNGVTQADGKQYQNLLGANLINKNTKEIIPIENSNQKETTVKFSKQDLAGNELKGATITLTGNNGDKQTWESDGKTKAKEFTVKEGKYTFTETAAPEGYKIATEIKFEVVRNKETQKLEIQNVEVGTGNKEGADGLLIMVDDYKEKETVVKFSKQDLAGNE